jgi:hypothetical protein
MSTVVQRKIKQESIMGINRNTLATFLNTLSWLTAITGIIFIIVSSICMDSHFVFYQGTSAFILSVFLKLQASGLSKKA